MLLAQPAVDPARVAAVGYCFGGTLVLELGRTGAPLAAIVGLHPGLTTTRPEDSVNIAVYGGARHSFTHPRAELAGSPALAYHRLGDERSWRAMVDLFDEVFAG